MYNTLRDLMFRMDAEKAHYFAMNSLRRISAFPGMRGWMSRYFAAPPMPKIIWGLRFRNPVGLAAGFDKNAKYLRELDMLGFGFVEIGTVTPLPQPGNEQPRLYRLPADKALINRMGFNNDGMDAVAGRLRAWRTKCPGSKLIIGGNIGKNKATPNEEAWMDYEKCFRALHDTVDFFVVNVSSPNTPGLRELQEKDALTGIFSRLIEINRAYAKPKPLLLKIAPDLNDAQLDDICRLALELPLDGLVATNTTISREGLSEKSSALAEKCGSGGLSGLPVRERATEVIRHLHRVTGGKIPIIGSGGIFSGKDAREKMEAGASLVQVWTGFIYEGPEIVSEILKGL